MAAYFFISLSIFFISYACKIFAFETGHRILDGDVAETGQFPYIVRVYVESGSKKNSCTGTIISHKQILTAAHCVVDATKMTVVHGDADHTELVKSKFKACDSPEHNYHCYHLDVSGRYVHPNYHAGRQKYDLAVLELSEPMPLDDGHEVFNCSRLGPGASRDCMVLGFGLHGNDEMDHKLRYKTGIESTICEQYSMTGPIKRLCLKGKHICSGDSGGPLICEGLLYGVASYAYQRKHDYCKAGRMDHYARTGGFARNFLMRFGCGSSMIHINFLYVVSCLLIQALYVLSII